jgi:antitoxin ParD1/3/4
MSDITLESAMSLNVSLPPELESRVRQHVESGLYSSASEVIREALRLFEAYQGIQAANLSALKADVVQGVADIDAGRVREVSMSSIKARGRAIRAAPRMTCWWLGYTLPKIALQRLIACLTRSKQRPSAYLTRFVIGKRR